jgi:hypothetical protein
LKKTIAITAETRSHALTLGLISDANSMTHLAIGLAGGKMELSNAALPFPNCQRNVQKLRAVRAAFPQGYAGGLTCALFG